MVLILISSLKQEGAHVVWVKTRYIHRSAYFYLTTLGVNLKGHGQAYSQMRSAVLHKEGGCVRTAQDTNIGLDFDRQDTIMDQSRTVTCENR